MLTPSRFFSTLEPSQLLMLAEETSSPSHVLTSSYRWSNCASRPQWPWFFRLDLQQACFSRAQVTLFTILSKYCCSSRNSSVYYFCKLSRILSPQKVVFSSGKCGKLLRLRKCRIEVQCGRFPSEKQSQVQRNLEFRNDKTSILECLHLWQAQNLR